jgi:hypothetical protein
MDHVRFLTLSTEAQFIPVIIKKKLNYYFLFLNSFNMLVSKIIFKNIYIFKNIFK